MENKYRFYEIKTANEEIDRLTLELGKHKDQSTELATLKQNMAAAELASQTAITTLEQTKKEHNTILEALKKDNEIKLADLNLELANARKSAGAEASRIMASVGLTPDQIPTEPQQEPTLKEKWASMKPGAERFQFAKTHWAELNKE